MHQFDGVECGLSITWDASEGGGANSDDLRPCGFWGQGVCWAVKGYKRYRLFENKLPSK